MRKFGIWEERTKTHTQVNRSYPAHIELSSSSKGYKVKIVIGSVIITKEITKAENDAIYNEISKEGNYV